MRRNRFWNFTLKINHSYILTTMDKITLTRTQLYDLVWSKTTTLLAKDYGISDGSLRTTCKKFNIPLPYAGYWAIIKHGKPARKVKLPTSFEGKDEIIITPPSEKPEAIQKEASIRTELIKEIESNYKHLLEVPLRLTNPNDLIIKAKDALMVKEDYWSDHGLIETKYGIIKIKVAPDNVPRALRFFDTIIKLLKARGHEIKFGRDGSCVELFDQLINIRVQEKLRFEDVKEGKYSWNTRNYFTTGVLTLRIWKTWVWEQKIWTDGKILIEDQLSKIIAGIELFALKEKEYQLKLEEGWRLQEEKQRLEQERFDQEELDGANFKKLLKQSKKWKQAMILNEYIKAVEDKAILSGGISDELKEWLIWAKEKVEKFNPINNQ